MPLQRMPTNPRSRSAYSVFPPFLNSTFKSRSGGVGQGPRVRLGVAPIEEAEVEVAALATSPWPLPSNSATTPVQTPPTPYIPEHPQLAHVDLRRLPIPLISLTKSCGIRFISRSAADGEQQLHDRAVRRPAVKEGVDELLHRGGCGRHAPPRFSSRRRSSTRCCSATCSSPSCSRTRSPSTSRASTSSAGGCPRRPSPTPTSTLRHARTVAAAHCAGLAPAGLWALRPPPPNAKALPTPSAPPPPHRAPDPHPWPLPPPPILAGAFAALLGGGALPRRDARRTRRARGARAPRLAARRAHRQSLPRASLPPWGGIAQQNPAQVPAAHLDATSAMVAALTPFRSSARAAGARATGRAPGPLSSSARCIGGTACSPA